MEVGVLLDRLVRERVPHLAESLQALIGEVGKPSYVALQRWSEVFALLDRTEDVLSFFSDDVFDLDLRGVETELAPASRGALQRLVASATDVTYRAARTKMGALCLDEKPAPSRLLQMTGSAAECFDSWRGLFPGGPKPFLPKGRVEAESAFSCLYEDLEQLVSVTGEDAVPAGGGALDEICSALDALASSRQTLVRLPRLAILEERLIAWGLAPLLDELRGEPPSGPEAAADRLHYMWLQSLLDEVTASQAELYSFESDIQARRVREFTALDREHLDTTPARVLRACAERLYAQRDRYPDESDLVENQARRRRGHLPLRDLLPRAEHVLTALKPCWAMSPLVVSSVLPARADLRRGDLRRGESGAACRCDSGHHACQADRRGRRRKPAATDHLLQLGRGG